MSLTLAAEFRDKVAYIEQLIRSEYRILPVKELILTAVTKTVGVDGISGSGPH